MIFTTHSNDALMPLPSKAIWAAYDGNVLQGKLDVEALRTITGQIEAELAVFVEDELAERLVATAIRHHGGIALDTVQIHGMSGAGSAVKVNKHHNLDPSVAFPSVCFLDGDQGANPDERVFCLPGDSHPESYIFDKVMDCLESSVAVLTVAMQLPPGKQSAVEKAVKARAASNNDRHVIYEQIGTDLGFTPEAIVQGAFLAVWAQEYPDDVEVIAGALLEILSPGA